MIPLHDGTASSLLLGSVGVLSLVDLRWKVSDARVLFHGETVAYLAPDRRHHEIAGVVAVADQSVEKGQLVMSSLMVLIRYK